MRITATILLLIFWGESFSQIQVDKMWRKNNTDSIFRITILSSDTSWIFCYTNSNKLNVSDTAGAFVPYLRKTGSAANLTNFPPLNQNTTGTAAGLSANIAESQVTNLVTDLAAKAPLTSPTLVTPVLGVATGTSLAVTGVITSSGGGVGYASGNGGTVTQATNKSTGVTLNKLAGDITLNAAALAAAAIVSFTLTNSTIAATDVIHVQHQATGTFGAYTINGRTAAGSAVISIRNNTAGSLGEAIAIRFIVIKSTIN